MPKTTGNRTNTINGYWLAAYQSSPVRCGLWGIALSSHFGKPTDCAICDERASQSACIALEKTASPTGVYIYTNRWRTAFWRSRRGPRILAAGGRFPRAIISTQPRRPFGGHVLSRGHARGGLRRQNRCYGLGLVAGGAHGKRCVFVSDAGVRSRVSFRTEHDPELIAAPPLAKAGSQTASTLPILLCRPGPSR